MLKLSPRDLNGDANLDRIVTSPKPVDADNVSFSISGVFSPRIFGNLGNSVSWSCNCGHLTAEFNKGVLCTQPNCNSVVDYKGLAIEREGWVDLHAPLIHPLFYRYIGKVIGKTALDRLINYKSEIKVEGHLEEPLMKHPYTGIGVAKFRENFVDILTDFCERKSGKEKEFHFIMENIDLIFTDYYPVINSKLRPAIVVDGEFSFDAINALYNGLILNCNLLKSLTSAENIPLNTQALAYKNQQILNNIYDNIITSLTHKDGYIRGTLLGNRLNFTSRTVIAPLSGDYAMDDAIIPYIGAVELFRPQIIRKLSILKKISYIKADQIWFEATLNFDPMVYKIVKEIISKNNVGMVINRNPTIGLGSILYLNIKDVKMDIMDKTTSIHNLILSCLGADYDGDVLNFIVIFSDQFNEMFEKFRPHNILVDVDTGGFNSAFLPAKDTLLGLESLFS